MPQFNTDSPVNTSNSSDDIHARFFSCDHPTTELRVLTASNGTLHFRYQCLRCGALTESVRRKDIQRAISRIPAWDSELPQRWYRERNALYQQAYDAIRTRKKEEFWEWYERYLETDKWKGIRDRVLTRADNRCEGCGRRRATQVHHLSYAHVGEEFLFELVALCRDCHARLHPQHERDYEAPVLILRESEAS